ncbi:signal peptide containing protein [Cryptosporidium canis]|uniref:Signal peptide containing protein n=1 Tax=Cryptosporidium canis TaxID=195482 RepID=A0ABQ8P1K9_9CRYT|nr:signal peptide containing protein [Cryptosporidium canis]
MVNVLNDLSSSTIFIFLYGISFALILQGGVTLNLGSLWINLLYWPIKYSGLITSIQFTIYSIGGLSLSEIYRLCFLESGSIRHFFLTCFVISFLIGFFSIYMIINIEKKIILNKGEISENSNIINDAEFNDSKKYSMEDINSLLAMEEIDTNQNKEIEESKSINEIFMSNDRYFDEYSKSENMNNQSVINKIKNYNENKYTKDLIIRSQINDNIIQPKPKCMGRSENLLINQERQEKYQHIKLSIVNFLKLISNLETISLIFVYLFTISTGQFFGTFIQRFSIYYIPGITKEKSIRMIQILTIIELFVRVISGYLSDLLANNRIMYKSTQTIILTLIMSLSLLLIDYLKSYWLVVIFGVGFSYAGMYSIAPSYIRSLFSPTEFALVNSFCYSMVIPGNLILSLVLANTPQKYTISLQIIGYLSLIPLSIMLIYKIKYLYKKCVVVNNNEIDLDIVNNEKVEHEENINRNLIENIEYGIDKIAQDITLLQKDISNIQKVMCEINLIDKFKKSNKDNNNNNNSLTTSTHSSSSSILTSSGDLSKNTSMSNIKN